MEYFSLKNPKFGYLKPCLRRSGFAQAGETNPKLKFQNSKLFVWRIAILNIGAYSGFSALDLEFLTEQIPQETKNRVGV
jgi:hypothetical protein